MNRPALVLTGVDSFVVEQRPPAESTGDAVAIDIDLVGLCGSDVHIVEGSHPRARFPLVLGHELVGRATAGQLAGRAVVVDPLIACGDCSACRLGERHVCANLRLIGIDRDGGLSGRVVVDSERVHVVPAGLDPVVAAWQNRWGRRPRNPSRSRRRWRHDRDHGGTDRAPPRRSQATGRGGP
jgi:threonine dehydrogenase-like Zn-dependent dehydrogenase